MKKTFQNISNDSVVQIKHFLFTSGGLWQEICKLLKNECWETLRDNWENQGRGVFPEFKNNLVWFNEGVECEVLQPGKTWQKGKFRIQITLEFCPDEPEPQPTPELAEIESPLDDLRQKLNEITS
ncbi:MAG: KGK domain-containing protein [Nostocaceae cyanobacterium]|nr:KGK domain-containing protein [Nostocaceae cyanobacterium]